MFEEILEVGADSVDVLLEALLEYLDDGAGSGAQRVAAECVEVAAPGQHLRDLRPPDEKRIGGGGFSAPRPNVAFGSSERGDG